MRRCAALMALAAGMLHAADLTGIWIGQIPARNGEMQDISFQLTQSGSKLSGKLYGDYRSSRVVEGFVSGELVTFVIAAQEQAGNQINESRIRFTGRLNNGELELTREREASMNAGNKGGVQNRNNARTTFRLKKLL